MANANDQIVIDMHPITLDDSFRRVYIDYKPPGPNTGYPQTWAGFHHARLCVASRLSGPVDPAHPQQPRPVLKGNGQPMEPSKTLFDPATGYPNLVPADEDTGESWGFTFGREKLGAVRGQDLILERDTRAALSWKYWEGSWQRFVGYTRVDDAGIQAKAERIFRERFQRYNVAINSCNDFAFALADEIVDRDTLPTGDVYSLWSLMDWNKKHQLL